jgi:glycosyltransferase involved in cell wall biosynthesis
MISILLATFNGHKFIEESINSILNQSFNDFELLIGLNGENEATKNILKNYNDNRIKIFDYGNDKGKSKTLNKLLQVAKYDWVGIQDDDDVWLPQKLETQIKFIEHFDVIGSLINYISESGKIIGSPNLSINHDEIKIKSLSLYYS